MRVHAINYNKMPAIKSILCHYFQQLPFLSSKLKQIISFVFSTCTLKLCFRLKFFDMYVCKYKVLQVYKIMIFTDQEKFKNLFLCCIMYPLNLHKPHISHYSGFLACLYINCHSKGTVRPTQKPLHTFYSP